MNFKALYDLIVESDQANNIVLDEELKNYVTTVIYNNESEAKLCYRFLKQYGYDKKGVLVGHLPHWKRPLPIKHKTTYDEFYMLLIPIKFTKEERKELKTEIDRFFKGLKKSTLIDYKSRKFELGSKLIGHGGVVIYDPMNEYSLDSETKETWRDVLTTL